MTHEAEILQLRTELMGHLRPWIQDNALPQSHALNGLVSHQIPLPRYLALHAAAEAAERGVKRH
ncbi:MAG: hypothetical protein LM514_05345 [Streptococcus sp.]|nr:hypothetical protein [Streptococcus sp.]